MYENEQLMLDTIENHHHTKEYFYAKLARFYVKPGMSDIKIFQKNMYIFHENVHCVFHSFFAIGMQFKVRKVIWSYFRILMGIPETPQPQPQSQYLIFFRKSKFIFKKIYEEFSHCEKLY